MTENQKFNNWYCDSDTDGIAWLHFDMPDSGANVLSKEVLLELDLILKDIEKESPKGLVILSAKSSGFIAGADIKEFTKLKDSAEALELIRRGQSVFDHLESLPFPTVALINGFCLGGGMELALACRIRVAEESPSTRLGLPEVQLGIHPGFGGTVRLPPLVGAPVAMDLMLTGRTIDARKARKIGLVDYVTPSRHLKAQAKKCALNPGPSRRSSLKVRLTNHSLVRPFLKKILVKNVKKRASAVHYPAPYAIIDLWADHADDSEKMMKEEAKSISTLIVSETARNLVRIFFLRERLKSLGKTRDFKAKHVHVVGAGVMGGDIAAWCALRGLHVTLQDREPKFIAPAMKRAHDLFKRRLKVPRLIQAAMDRLMPDVDGATGLPKADVVIEAIFENVEAKQDLFRHIESRVKPDTILATNTSSIPLEEISGALKNPERLVGIHFFNPVAKMQLVEVVAGSATGEKEMKNASAFVRQIDRLPLPVKSTPGFLVNRILMPYLMEAVALAEEGEPPELIDKAALDFGMPMGPLLLADTVGLDICLHVGEILSQRIGGSVPVSLKKLVDSGKTGKKSGEGFYKYKGGKQILAKTGVTHLPSSDVTDRLMLRMLNEAMACLKEGVVEDADLLDAGVIFGTGFAPFRGGPMNYCETKGREQMRGRLKELEEKSGERFRPDSAWGE